MIVSTSGRYPGRATRILACSLAIALLKGLGEERVLPQPRPDCFCD